MMALTVLCVACFPFNPLVLTGLIEPVFYLPSFIMGWVVWGVGMMLVLTPIIMFPRRGNVPKGKSFIHTTRLVDKGIYAMIRHPQYLGGILAIFIATPLLYLHWLFVVLGVPGIVFLYMSTREEETRLIERFGADYQSYMHKVPRMNLVSGLLRLRRSRK
jgi:protein-S-isoprenylcysteine O-methyltransferase Ste14